MKHNKLYQIILHFMVNKKLKKYFLRQSVEKIIGIFLFYVLLPSNYFNF